MMLAVLLFFSASVVVGHASARCEQIAIGSCSNVGYNATILPNFLGHGTQQAADVAIQPLMPLMSHKCSTHVKLFICSAYAPMCSEQFPEPIFACRGFCEKVQEDCKAELESLGLSEWPRELNCSRFPEEPALCMKPNTDTVVHHHNSINVEELSESNPENCVSNCKHYSCHSKSVEDDKKIATFEIWIAVWSMVPLIFTAFALVTFVVQPKRFRWPARPVLYLTSCGFVTCTIYLIRWIEGPYTCTGDLMSERPSGSLSCIGISLILLFCDVAYTLWWTIFCFVWYLSAAKEWSTEAIEKISTRLHTVVWVFSAIPMFYILLSNNIIINYLSGFCEVRNKALVFFQLFFMTASIILAILTSVALKNVRKTLVSVGRSTIKLERLFYRLLVISLGIWATHFLYLLCQFYDTFTVALLKLVLRSISIIFATLWVYSPKSFEMWSTQLCFCKNTKESHESSPFLNISALKIFRNNSKATQNNVNGKNVICDSKRTIFEIFFNSNQQSNVPVTRV